VDGGWHVEREPAVIKPADVQAPVGEWDGEGDGFAAYTELESLPGVARAHANTLPTARAIGELALPLFERGQGVPAGQARPLYIRQRVALTTAERNAGVRL
jgi:tRNA threonylcarbamoyladenosine biosynthesis protein TsaB